MQRAIRHLHESVSNLETMMPDVPISVMEGQVETLQSQLSGCMHQVSDLESMMPDVPISVIEGQLETLQSQLDQCMSSE